MPPKFTVERFETYPGSQHEYVIIHASGFGEGHPGFVLIANDDPLLGDDGLSEGSGIFRPEFGKELKRRLEPQAEPGEEGHPLKNTLDK